jgi:Fe-S-cluster containining protein
MPATNPCQRCGACCAFFEVLFDQNETDDFREGGVPVQYTVGVGQARCAMRGTESRNKRCAALEGVVSREVSCAIYNQRPSCCRDFLAGWEKDIVNPVCNRARTSYGLPPFDDF